MSQEYPYLDFVISCKSENIQYGQQLTVKKRVNWSHRQILSNINLSISSSITFYVQLFLGKVFDFALFNLAHYS